MPPSPPAADGRRIAAGVHLPVAGDSSLANRGRVAAATRSTSQEQHLHLSLVLPAWQNLVDLGAAELPHPPPYSCVWLSTTPSTYFHA